MKIEVWDRPAPEELQAIRLKHSRSLQLQFDPAILGAVERLRARGTQSLNRLFDESFELGKRQLTGVNFRRLLAGNTRRAVFGVMAGKLYLQGQRKHVWSQPFF